MTLAKRDWVPAGCEARVQEIAGETAKSGSDALRDRIEGLAKETCTSMSASVSTSTPRPT